VFYSTLSIIMFYILFHLSQNFMKTKVIYITHFLPYNGVYYDGLVQAAICRSYPYYSFRQMDCITSKQRCSVTDIDGIYL